jgi:hypothetical protein
MSPKQSLGDIVFAPFLIIMAPKRSLWDILLLLCFLLLLSPQTKFEDLLFLHRFLLLLLFFLFFSEWTCPTKFSEHDDPIFTKLHRKVHSGLGFFKMATVAMETLNVCQNLWPHLYRKPPKGFPQDLAYILSRVGRIFWQKKSRANGRHF